MIVLDERGKACPLPVVETKKALEAAASGETARVMVDNEIAVQNLRKLADHKGWSFCWEKRGGGDFQAWITREAGESLSEEKQRETEEPECPDCRTEGIRPGLTAVISSEAMGQGDDRLGKILMKSFLFALTQQDILPETVLLYNGGAFLSCEGSESLEDLKKLEELGVEILTCGTCLDFYGLKEKLAVGGISNMYEIVEKQCRAHTILRP
mgnify:FL=1